MDTAKEDVDALHLLPSIRDDRGGMARRAPHRAWHIFTSRGKSARPTRRRGPASRVAQFSTIHSLFMASSSAECVEAFLSGPFSLCADAIQTALSQQREAQCFEHLGVAGTTGSSTAPKSGCGARESEARTRTRSSRASAGRMRSRPWWSPMVAVACCGAAGLHPAGGPGRPAARRTGDTDPGRCRLSGPGGTDRRAGRDATDPNVQEELPRMVRGDLPAVTQGALLAPHPGRARHRPSDELAVAVPPPGAP